MEFIEEQRRKSFAESLYSFIKDYPLLDFETKNKKYSLILEQLSSFEKQGLFLPEKIRKSICQNLSFAGRFYGFLYWVNRKLFIPLKEILGVNFYSKSWVPSRAKIVNEAVINYEEVSISVYAIETIKGPSLKAFTMGDIICVDSLYVKEAPFHSQNEEDILKYLFYEELRHEIDRITGLKKIGISLTTFLEDFSDEINYQIVEALLNKQGFFHSVCVLDKEVEEDKNYWLVLAKEFSGLVAAIVFSDQPTLHLAELFVRKNQLDRPIHEIADELCLLEFYRAVLKSKDHSLSNSCLDKLLASLKFSEIETALYPLRSNQIRLLAKNEVYPRIFTIPLDEPPLPEVLPDGSIKERISPDKIMSLIKRE